MVSSRISRIWDRIVLTAVTFWILFGVTAVFKPRSAADLGAASQTTMLEGYFLVVSVLFVPLYLYGLCLLVETLSRRKELRSTDL